MSFRKILCAIDFSENATEALHTAVRLATEHGSELVIAHAWYLTPTAFAGEYVYPADLVKELSADAERALAELVVQAKTWGAVKVSSQLADGPPWQEIVKIAEQTADVDLIVLGTRGRTGLSRMFMGSICEMVIRHAPCSVLAIPKGVAAKPFTRVLCPIDFSDSSRDALALGAELVRGAEASVTLLHVIETSAVYSHDETVLQIVSQEVGAAREHLQHWAVELAAKHPTATTSLVRVGRATHEIQSVLDDVGTFDLVAMGSHGRTGLRRMFLGSVAEKCVRHAHRPVVVVRARRA